MHVRVGIPSPIVMTARHLAKRAPSLRYSVTRSRSPSKPSVIFSPGKLAIALAPLSTLIPGTIPCCSSTSTKLRPSRVFCRIVSSNRITPLMNSPAPFVVNKISRYIRRFSSVEGTLMLFNRFSIVPELSSAARIPFPGATSFLAMVSKFSVFIIVLFFELNCQLLPRKIFAEMQTKTDDTIMGTGLDLQTHLWYMRSSDQDRYFGGDGCGASHSSGGPRRPLMHPLQCAGSASV